MADVKQSDFENNKPNEPNEFDPIDPTPLTMDENSNPSWMIEEGNAPRKILSIAGKQNFQDIGTAPDASPIESDT